MIVYTQFKKKPLLFKNPVSLITCAHPALLEGCFTQMEAALKSGYYLAGFLSYEAGYAFEPCLRREKDYDFPLIYMGVYRAPGYSSSLFQKSTHASPLSNLRLNITQEQYSANIAAIRRYIRAGDVYQITYCLKLLFDFSASPEQLYCRLLKEQPVPYPAFIQTDKFHILSLSPEKFMQKKSGRIITKPMKGTWPRSPGPAADLLGRWRFCRDAKNRAENVMIADLLRNDLGRIGRHIRAPKLFEVAKYKTLYQMTSTVSAKLEKDISLYRLFASLFPSGSVTGAPKIRAMEIIQELEKEERRIYTGAIGYITPDKDLFFNIPIRTLLIRNGQGEMGIGGGIVWDSTAQGEWDEGLLKARFVTGATP